MSWFSLEDLDSRVFIEHAKRVYEGYTKTLSQLNWPPWVAWVIFDSDEYKLLFCQSDQDMP